MIEINLLPVREARRKESLRFQFTIFALTIFLLLLIIAYLNWNVNKKEKYINAQLKKVQEEVEQLKIKVGEIDELKKQKEKLEQKVSVIKELERGRLRATFILGELSQKIPDKVWIDSLDKSGRTLKMTGVALDNETIANFMTSLEQSKYFSGIELEVTEQINKGDLKLQKFTLRCSTSI